MTTDIEKVVTAINTQIDFREAKLSNSFFYSSLPFCAIDAIFSIGVKYTNVQRCVANVASYLTLNQFRKYESALPEISKQISVEEFLNEIKNVPEEKIVDDIFVNRQRTSTKNGILKAKAVVDFCSVLEKYNINYFQDVSHITDDCITALCSVKGQASGISTKYFLMLAGDDNFIKMDRMLLSFTERALGKTRMNENEAEEILIKACDELIAKNNNLTRRKIDHEIWKYEKEYREKNRKTVRLSRLNSCVG